MLSLVLYVSLIFFCVFFLYNYQEKNKKTIVIKIGNIKTITTKNVNFVIKSLICMFPIIIIYSLRDGVGTDFYSYEKIYNTIHDVSFSKYLNLHILNIGEYYVEVGYYLLNRIAINYHVLLTIEITLIFCLLFVALKDYRDKLSLWLSIFIYLSIQFIYSMNVVRFSIAIVLVLISYKFIIKGNFVRFAICIVAAACFHKTALFCVALYFVCEFERSYINKIRNILMMFLILLFPLISQYLFGALSVVPIFSRYFSSSIYAVDEVADIGFGWLLHILPVIVPLVFFAWKYINENSESRTLFRIYIMNIPFRMLGLYNTWYTRFARYSQIVEVIFIPLIVNRIKNKNIKRFLTLYYVSWYIFYFCYYAIVNDSGDSLSYAWILSRKR